jgi:hypothetical protein
MQSKPVNGPPKSNSPTPHAATREYQQSRHRGGAGKRKDISPRRSRRCAGSAGKIVLSGRIDSHATGNQSRVAPELGRRWRGHLCWRAPQFDSEFV